MLVPAHLGGGLVLAKGGEKKVFDAKQTSVQSGKVPRVRIVQLFWGPRTGLVSPKFRPTARLWNFTG